MTTFQPIQQEEVNERFADAVRMYVLKLLKESRPGHCQRISTLTEPIMRKVCIILNEDKIQHSLAADIVYVVGARQQVQYPWQISATKLIELRNAEQRPLLAFIQPGLKAAAGDSFDVSTFAEINLTTVPANLRADLRKQIPEPLGGLIDRTIHKHKVNEESQIRYYLTIIKNGFDVELAGAALFELGLVPDFELYNHQQHIEVRLEQNADALNRLLDTSDSLLARIHNLGFKPNSIQSKLYRFLRSYRMADIQNWGTDLTTDIQLRDLCFDRWPLKDEPTDSILVYIHDPDLPVREPGQSGPDNPRYLDVNRATTVKVAWHTEPKPVLVTDLAYFRIELVSTDGDLITWQSKNIPKSSSSKNVKIKDFREQVEDGLYYFRIRGYTEGGELVSKEEPDVDTEKPSPYRDPNNPQGKKVCESDDIWLWKSKVGEVPPADPIRNAPVNSFLDAQLQVQFSALDRNDDPFDKSLYPQADKTGWATPKNKSAEAIYNIVYDAQKRFTLPISSLLRRIESETLSKPEMLGRWRLLFESGQTHHEVEPTERQFHNRSQVPDEFVSARARLFKAIHNQQQDLLVETVDILLLEDLILEYVATYQSWLEKVSTYFDETVVVADETGRKRTDAVFLDIDTIQIEIPGETSINDRVYLIAPTHPLRLLWQLQRSSLARDWLQRAMHSDQPAQSLTMGIRRFLRQGLTPFNLPPFIRPALETHPSGIPHFYIEQGPITPFWSLYIRENVQDRRSLRARVKKALAIGRSSSESSITGGINHHVLAEKIQRYLIQHPYVQTLKINGFNPGDAELLVDAILQVEKDRLNTPKSLRYELHLFTQDMQIEDTGTAVDELMNPQRQVSPEADAFSEGSQNHLFPKLRFYRHHQQEFLLNPETFQAHLSILHDVFPVSVGLDASILGRSSFLHGLIQSPVTAFGQEEQAEYAWRRQITPHACAELSENDSKSEMLATLLDKLANLQAAVAAGKFVSDVKPTLHLKLEIDHKNLLNLVHETSDWVFVIDRNLGLEYFDSVILKGRPVYLLDFIPEFAEMDTERLFLTTQLTEEITGFIQPALEERNLALDELGVLFFLKLLRSMSGRLALKLLSAPNNVSEVLGLAFARLFMEQFGLLDDSILIPLDAHLDLFRPENETGSLNDEVSFQRSDLLLIQGDIETRTLHFHIIEVKLRSDLGDLSAYLSLRQHIEGQLNDSELKLRKHFDPYQASEDRIDRQIKIRELVSLLTFYLQRSERYGLIGSTNAAHLLSFINDLDQGYQITISRSGLIFDFGFQDLQQDEEHAGLIFYRIGDDYMRRMVETGLRRDGLLQEINVQPVLIEEAQEEREKRQEIIRDTDMRRDRKYETVRSGFRPTTGPKLQPEQKTADHEKTVSFLKTEQTLGTPLESISSTQPKQTNLQANPEKETTKGLNLLSADISNQSVQSVEPKYKNDMTQPPYDILIGDVDKSRQYGIIGKSSGRLLAIDLNGTNTISVFGVQGGGKSYTIGTIAEMATQAISRINHLPSPLATVIFHYHESQDYPPEFVSMVEPNSRESELKVLEQEYGVQPVALNDVLILTSSDKLSERRLEFPNVHVEPISFSSTELQIRDWRFLMGVGGNQMYMRQINMIMRELRQEMTLDTLKERVSESDLTDQQKHIANLRLNFAAQFIDDNRRLAEMLRPGRLIIIDLRDEFIDKDEALGLFVVMLNIFANAGRDEKFNKLIVFDEAHKYMDNPDLTGHIVDAIRQMRHQGVSVLIASQDPPSLPNAIIELSSVVILHRFNSPQWLKHIQKSITALSDLTPTQMASLAQGEAFLWATKATERLFSQKAVRVRFRPRVTKHGGGTKTAA